MRGVFADERFVIAKEKEQLIFVSRVSNRPFEVPASNNGKDVSENRFSQSNIKIDFDIFFIKEDNSKEKVLSGTIEQPPKFGAYSCLILKFVKENEKEGLKEPSPSSNPPCYTLNVQVNRFKEGEYELRMRVANSNQSDFEQGNETIIRRFRIFKVVER